jgi:hypothetical protein
MKKEGANIVILSPMIKVGEEWVDEESVVFTICWVAK